jgi:hypothetical protein
MSDARIYEHFKIYPYDIIVRTALKSHDIIEVCVKDRMRKMHVTQFNLDRHQVRSLRNALTEFLLEIEAKELQEVTQEKQLTDSDTKRLRVLTPRKVQLSYDDFPDTHSEFFTKLKTMREDSKARMVHANSSVDRITVEDTIDDDIEADTIVDYVDTVQSKNVTKTCTHPTIMVIFNPIHAAEFMDYKQVRECYPRFQGPCPICNKIVTVYASVDHKRAGRW